MALRISRQELVQLIRETRFCYRNAVGRKIRSKIINRIVSVSGMRMKWLIRLLSGAEEKQNSMRGAPEKLTGSDVLLLKELWLFLNQPGAGYLHRMLPELLREYKEIGGGSCEAQQVERICRVSYKATESTEAIPNASSERREGSESLHQESKYTVGRTHTTGGKARLHMHRYRYALWDNNGWLICGHVYMDGRIQWLHHQCCHVEPQL